MCLIVHRKGYGHITEEIINHNLIFNGDGFGIAWREGSTIHHSKWGPKDDDQFVKVLSEVDRRKGVEYVAHFRTATHGPACRELSHPFVYKDNRGKEVVIFHNGIIDINTPKEDSDTSFFVRNVLARLPDQWWRRDHLLYLVEKAIGWSRMLVMSGREVIRLNEEEWEQKDGIWYSTRPTGWAKTTGWNVNGTSVNGTKVSTYDEGWDDYKPGSIKPTSTADLMARTSVKADEPVLVETEMEVDDCKSGWWTRDGHQVIPTGRNAADEAGVETGDLMCLDCKTQGELYVYGGKAYLDIAHIPGPPAIKATN